MPRDALPQRLSGRAVLGWIALAVAFVLAIRPGAKVMTGAERLPRNDISVLEADFANLLTFVPPSARAGWLLPRDPPPGMVTIMTVSRYAVLPRRLGTVILTDCVARGATACGIESVDVVFVPAARGYSAVEAASLLGFQVAPVGGPGGKYTIAWRKR